MATIVAEPEATPVTRPEADTLARSGAALDHVTVLPVSTLPAASRRTAVACDVCPGMIVVALNDTLMLATAAGGGASTLACVAALLPSTVAVIVVLPTDTPVTRPSFETVATVGFDDDHDGTRVLNVLPDASYAVATS